MQIIVDTVSKRFRGKQAGQDVLAVDDVSLSVDDREFLCLLVIFGLGNPPIIAMMAIVCFYPVAVNAMAGVRSVEPVLIRMATNLGASKPQIMLKIVLSGALPIMFAGLRLALGLALLGDVAAEFAASTDGIGALTWLYWQVYQIENMYAYLTVIAIVGAFLTYGLEWLGNGLMPWSRPLRGA